jgi:hypothetical protein
MMSFRPKGGILADQSIDFSHGSMYVLVRRLMPRTRARNDSSVAARHSLEANGWLNRSPLRGLSCASRRF